MIFTDGDLQKLKNKDGYWRTTVKMNEGQSESWGFVDGDAITALINRLEAAEQAVEMARCVETGIPKPTSWKYFHLLWLRWKEAAGK